MNPLRVSATASVEALDQLQAVLAQFWNDRRLPAEARYAFELALEEFLMNVVMHGRPTAPEKTVWLELEDDAEAVHMVFEDDCEAFDPTAHATPDTSLDAEARDIGGLGIHLVRQMMDGVDYAHLAGRNRITLNKRLSSG